MAVRPLPKIYLKVFYTHLKTLDKLTKKELLRRAKNKGGFNINYLIFNKINLNANLIYTGRRYDMDYSTWPAQRKILDNYTKIDLTAYYDIYENLQFFSRMENLTNQDYEDVIGYGTFQRSVYLGFKFSY